VTSLVGSATGSEEAERAPPPPPVRPVARIAASGSSSATLVTIFELTADLPIAALLASQSVFSLLHGGGQAAAVAGYLAQHPADAVFARMARWADRRKAARHVTALGLQLHEEERGLGSAAALEQQRSNGAAAAVVQAAVNDGDSHRFHPMLPQLLTKQSYTVYFTDI
jgi:hypothetical protein